MLQVSLFPEFPGQRAPLTVEGMVVPTEAPESVELGQGDAQFGVARMLAVVVQVLLSVRRLPVDGGKVR